MEIENGIVRTAPQQLAKNTLDLYNLLNDFSNIIYAQSELNENGFAFYYYHPHILRAILYWIQSFMKSCYSNANVLYLKRKTKVEKHSIGH